MANDWYALHSKPHREDALWHHLQAEGYEVFYPCLRVNPVNRRSRKVRSYFPGYLFVRVDMTSVGVSTFRWMPCAIGLVCFGGLPAPVPNVLIEAVSLNVERINLAGGEIFCRFRPGDRVRVEEGPFAGYEAIFDARLNGKERVRVLMQLLNRQTIPVEMRITQLKRCDGEPASRILKDHAGFQREGHRIRA
jgi:transcription antitermination factor NusG